MQTLMTIITVVVLLALVGGAIFLAVFNLPR